MSFGETFSNGNQNVELPQAQSAVKKLKILSNNECMVIYETLLEKSIDRKLKKGMTATVASLYSVFIHTDQRIWKQSGYGEHGDVSHKRTKNCGQKRVELGLALFKDIPLRKRTSLAALACAINMRRTTLFRIFKAGDEEDPLCTCGNKHFIGKVMFLVAIARPSAIQSLHYQEAPRNVDELVAAVEKSFDGFPAGGSNRYKISKTMLERDGKLPTQMNCEAALVQEVVDLLS
ncbi:hypothetical protein COLO4_06538 [Corchorus olitorius]|uniref:DUF7769 domain-containing protein n=1 Tax=Corchorus olitorius TaxID=93759 RepID=A0A1R3KMQ1_9ROSI|nr:hypothetical protein COLO4_06538 [Corchorus olitorius]